MQNSNMELCAERNQLMFELSVYMHTVVRKLSDNESGSDAPNKILFILQVQQPTSLKNLCDILGVSASAGSIMVDKYVKQGLIARTPDPSDRRKIVLSLTEAGTELVKQNTEQLNTNLNGSLESLSQEENAEFHAALSTVAKYIQRLYPHLIATPQSNQANSST